MNKKDLGWCFLGLALVAATPWLSVAARPATTGPVALQVDNLATPLGIDDVTPLFSWALQDPAKGARQTAYQILVASRPELLTGAPGKVDLWDSGRIASDRSLNLRYAGAPLEASTRYFWRVTVWDAAGKPYRPSDVSWFETGLLIQDNWHAAWIGYETGEEDAVRHASAQWIASPDAKALAAEEAAQQRFEYRKTVQLNKAVRHATLYATGQDTVSAWINGTQVLQADPLPPWKQMPWKKFVAADATVKLAAGRQRHRH